MPIAFIRKKLEQWPLHIVLLVLFFILHGYLETDGLVPLPDLLLYGAIVLVVAGILFLALLGIYREKFRSGFLVTIMLFVYLFYGVLQDSFQRSAFMSRVSRDHILIPLLIILVLLIAAGLKSVKTIPAKLTLYLNLLLLIYIFTDLLLQFNRPEPDIVKMSGDRNIRVCDTCAKPDIYLLLLDEYAGNEMLEKEFGYSNQPFVRALRNKGFFVADSPSSNYAYTPFSMACMFNMDYTGWKGSKEDINAKHYTMAANQIGRSAALNELQARGYELQNLSIFDIQNQPAAFDQGFMALKLRLVTDKTLWERLRKSLFWQFDKEGGWGKKLGWDGSERIRKGNAEMISRTISLANEKKGSRPQFVYTHLLMPHPPYLYDSVGQPVDAGYLSYLKYANSRVEFLVDEIMKAEKGGAVIIVMSDHGLREAALGRDSRDFNNNFNAVYLPRRNYNYFYSSISNVNQFRMLFNSLFDSGYEVLKDSVVF